MPPVPGLPPHRPGLLRFAPGSLVKNHKIWSVCPHFCISNDTSGKNLTQDTTKLGRSPTINILYGKDLADGRDPSNPCHVVE